MDKKAYLVICPHQDDELLTLSVPIVNAIANGYDVYAFLITDGAAASIREKLDLSVTDFVAARDKEFINSCKKLGITEDNIIIPPSRLPDGNIDVVDVLEFITPYIRGFNTKYKNLTIATISPFGPESQHCDHKTVGLAAVELKKDKSLKINKLELFLEPYLHEEKSPYKVVPPTSKDTIIASANSYRHSKYRITGQLESKRISAYLSKCEAYKYREPISKKIGKFFSRLLRPLDNLLMNLKCGRIDFDPTKLTTFDFIYNRPDLYRGIFETYEVIANEITFVCLVNFLGPRAEICVRLSNISDTALNILCDAVFRKHPEVNCINIMQTYSKFGISKEEKVYRLSLPNSVKVARGTYDSVPCESNFISNEYKLISRKKTIASIFTSEQCDAVYVDSYTEDAPEKLFNYMINFLNEKGKTEVILDKPILDAIEETVFNCKVYRNDFPTSNLPFVHFFFSKKNNFK